MHLLKKKCSNPIYIRSEISLSLSLLLSLSSDLQLLVSIYSRFRTPLWTVGADSNDHQVAVPSSFNHSTVVGIIETFWTILSLAGSMLVSLTSFFCRRTWNVVKSWPYKMYFGVRPSCIRCMWHSHQRWLWQMLRCALQESTYRSTVMLLTLWCRVMPRIHRRQRRWKGYEEYRPGIFWDWWARPADGCPRISFSMCHLYTVKVHKSVCPNGYTNSYEL